MSMTREQFFQCSFTSDGQRRTEYIRAWSPAAAKRALAEQLASEGIDLLGPIDVARKEPRVANSAAVLELARRSHA